MFPHTGWPEFSLLMSGFSGTCQPFFNPFRGMWKHINDNTVVGNISKAFLALSVAGKCRLFADYLRIFLRTTDVNTATNTTPIRICTAEIT